MFGICYIILVIFCYINVIFEIMIFFFINLLIYIVGFLIIGWWYVNVINKFYFVYLIEIVLNRL